ncbi:MAG: hypothetical protein FD178_803 [Ignavibacteria bacterium]|nr:MAG: hypothetical protein FD178_803 [Ignavibacteria bacterium]
MKYNKHYIPILKWKRAEQNSLKNLTDLQKNEITPLVELVMPKVNIYKDKGKKIPKTQNEIFNEMISDFRDVRIPQITEEINKSWGQKSLLIDFSLLYTVQLKVESILRIFESSKLIGLDLIPVVNLNDDEEIIQTICSIFTKQGASCLRLVPSDLNSIEKLNERIENFLKLHSLSESKIDLLIDIKEINELDGNYKRLINDSQNIMNLSEWRNFIFASGAFPEELSKYNIDESNHVPRYDWLNWLKIVSSGNLKRNPIFSDYTIRNPIYKESFQFHIPTTSIKYTFNESWLIMKGKKQRFELYLANANLLSTDAGIFYGEEFSYGDKYIAEKGRHYLNYIKNPKIKGTGSTETWLMAGINHHMACTIDQISKLV